MVGVMATADSAPKGDDTYILGLTGENQEEVVESLSEWGLTNPYLLVRTSRRSKLCLPFFLSVENVPCLTWYPTSLLRPSDQGGDCARSRPWKLRHRNVTCGSWWRRTTRRWGTSKFRHGRGQRCFYLCFCQHDECARCNVCFSNWRCAETAAAAETAVAVDDDLRDQLLVDALAAGVEQADFAAALDAPLGGEATTSV